MSCQIDVVVSPDGDDAAPGTAQQPLRTLAAAQQRIRALLASKPTRDLRVQLRGGVYRLHEPLVFTPADAPGPGQRVHWEAAPGERPMLSGGWPLGPWQRLLDPPAALPEAARGKVWYAALPEWADDTCAHEIWPRGLYAGDRRLLRARSAGFAPLPDPEGSETSHSDTVRVPEGIAADWPDLRSGELVIIPRHHWTMNVLPLKAFDARSNMLTTAVPCSYEMTANRREQSAWIENVLAVLDEPGEWVFDRDQQRIYLWPDDGDVPSEDICATLLTELVRVEGRLDECDTADTPVRNLTFRGLTFTCHNRYPWHGRTGAGMQHDWEAHDRPTAALRLRGATGCAVEACRFAHGEGAALRLDLYAQRNRVVGNHIEDLGGAGIILGGYGPGTKNVNRRNHILNNHIHHIGRTIWHGPAIFLWQSGENHVAHNLIHHTPYTGIVCSGRIQLDPQGADECSATIRWAEVSELLGPDYVQPAWHQAWKPDWQRREPLLHSRRNVIAYNEIHNVMQILGDGNGIYISGAGGGNIVRANHVHDCASPHLAEGIRCDDDQHETWIEGNLVHRFAGKTVGISVKGVNAIVNNIVACPLAPATRQGLIALQIGPLHDMPLRHNIVYATSADHPFYMQRRVKVHGDGPPPLVRDCDADDNLYWNTAVPELGEGHLAAERAHGVEHHSRSADPLFADPANGDFTMAPDSPAWQMGIAPLDVGRAGLCAHLPFHGEASSGGTPLPQSNASCHE